MLLRNDFRGTKHCGREWKRNRTKETNNEEMSREQREKKASTFNQYTMESRCNNNEILVIIKTNTSNILSFILLKSEIEREREKDYH